MRCFPGGEGDNPAIMRCNKTGKKASILEKETRKGIKKERKKEKKKGKEKRVTKRPTVQSCYPSRTYRLAYERPLGGLGERIVK